MPYGLQARCSWCCPSAGGGRGEPLPPLPQQQQHEPTPSLLSPSPPPQTPASQVLAPLKSLERVYLRDTDLKGAVPCGLVDGKGDLRVLDLSDTDASGALPGCVLAVRVGFFLRGSLGRETDASLPASALCSVWLGVVQFSAVFA